MHMQQKPYPGHGLESGVVHQDLSNRLCVQVTQPTVTELGTPTVPWFCSTSSCFPPVQRREALQGS